MPDNEVPHDQLIADLKVLDVPDREGVREEIGKHTHSKISAKVKIGSELFVFENGILVKIDKQTEEGGNNPPSSTS